jgi:hypothetical protein
MPWFGHQSLVFGNFISFLIEDHTFASLSRRDPNPRACSRNDLSFLPERKCSGWRKRFELWFPQYVKEDMVTHNRSIRVSIGETS